MWPAGVKSEARSEGGADRMGTMTPFHDHPLVQAFLTHAIDCPGDGGAEAGFVDWLQEENASLADVVCLYAGQPPTLVRPRQEQDEALRAVLALWCEVTERHAPTGDARRKVRWQFVRDAHMVTYFGRSVDRLRLKRHVLSLFPDVQAERVAAISEREYAGRSHSAGMILDFLNGIGFRTEPSFPINRHYSHESRHYEFRQTLTAPQWIAPPGMPNYPRDEAGRLTSEHRVEMEVTQWNEAVYQQLLRERRLDGR